MQFSFCEMPDQARDRQTLCLRCSCDSRNNAAPAHEVGIERRATLRGPKRLKLTDKMTGKDSDELPVSRRAELSTRPLMHGQGQSFQRRKAKRTGSRSKRYETLRVFIGQ
jgi:hypothetical protein